MVALFILFIIVINYYYKEWIVKQETGEKAEKKEKNILHSRSDQLV